MKLSLYNISSLFFVLIQRSKDQDFGRFTHKAEVHQLKSMELASFRSSDSIDFLTQVSPGFMAHHPRSKISCAMYPF